MMPFRHQYGRTLSYMICLVPLCLSFVLIPETASAARTVSGKRECATCHIMWLEDFKRKDKKPLISFEPKPVVETGKQDVASTERMCFSCHDGFVLDSRFLWKEKKHTHPVGVKPPKNMTIPTSKGKEIFPLNEDKKMYCGTCHSAHGVDWNEKISPIFLRVKNINSSLCLACHLPKSTGPKEGNHPVFKSLGKPPAALVHAGASFGDKDEVICESCHRTHGSKEKKLLVMNNQGSAMCQTCHANKRGIINSKHDMAQMAPELHNKNGHTVKQKGPCSSCHVPHGANSGTLWAQTISEKNKDKTAAMCFSCHNKEGVAKDKVPGKHSHPLNMSLASLGIKSDKKGWQSKSDSANDKETLHALPLFDKHGSRNPKNGKVSCPTCHDPHNWSTIKPGQTHKAEKTNPKERKGDGNSSFLRIAQGTQSNLCLNCHVNKRGILPSKHNLDKDMKEQLFAVQQQEKTENNPETLPEIGVCANCHSTHYGKGSYLRARGRGPGNRVIETWCRDCHRKDGLAKDKLIADHSHPLGTQPVKMKKNSGLPLFDKLGNRSANGTVDCATCHDPHQWSPQFAKSVNQSDYEEEGDGHNSFLRRAAAGESELCAQCHQDKTLVLGTDHDLRVTSPTTNKEQSGVCGQCHAIHQPTMTANLWGRKPGKANDAKEQQCRSCHSKGGIASAKLPVAAQHPQKVTVWSGKIRQINTKHPLPNIPVFNKEGKQQKTGMITCASCHDPHRWNPRQAKAGTGKNLEGDAMNSFLRNGDSQYIVCGDCHGQDGLFRYKYFHGKTSRKKHPLYN